MKVCVVGGGGREHALADVLSRDAEVVVSGGNPGIPGPTPAPATEIEADLYVVGPEAPLVDGLADELRAQGRLVFGPGADGAQLEGSKAWMKDLLATAGVPTAEHATFSDLDAGARPPRPPDPALRGEDRRARGRQGRGRDRVADRGAQRRGRLPVGRRVRRRGPHPGHRGGSHRAGAVPARGVRRRPRPCRCPPRRTSSGSGTTTRGPTRVGWGRTHRCRSVDDALVDDVMDRFLEPTLAALRDRGIDYRGVLYAGSDAHARRPEADRVQRPLRRSRDARWSRPGSRRRSPICSPRRPTGELRSTPTFTSDAMVTVVCAAEHYPATPRTGDRIDGLEAAQAIDGVTVYCAGVGRHPEGSLVTAGGRVLDVCGRGPTIDAARAAAYEGVAAISWRGMQHRGDIARGGRHELSWSARAGRPEGCSARAGQPGSVLFRPGLRRCASAAAPRSGPRGPGRSSAQRCAGRTPRGGPAARSGGRRHDPAPQIDLERSEVELVLERRLRHRHRGHGGAVPPPAPLRPRHLRCFGARTLAPLWRTPANTRAHPTHIAGRLGPNGKTRQSSQYSRPHCPHEPLEMIPLCFVHPYIRPLRVPPDGGSAPLPDPLHRFSVPDTRGIGGRPDAAC